MQRYFLLFILFFSLFLFPTTYAQSCSNGGTGQSTTFTLNNNLTEPVTVYWIDFSCVEQWYGTISLGGSLTQQTFDGHEWVIRNESSVLIQEFTASTEMPIITLGSSSNYIVDINDMPTEFPILESECDVRSVPIELGFDQFYQKYCDFVGLPILSSADVPNEALEQAWIIVANMLYDLPNILQEMVNNNVRVVIMGENEVTTDVPEHAFLADDLTIDWDERARGLGGTLYTPVVSGAEENVLCYTSDRYLGENIFLHEFAHTIKDTGLQPLYDFDTQVQIAYDNAMMNDLWEDTYASSNMDEYWAEGVQSYFNTNIGASQANGIHNYVNTRDELQDYDLQLFELIDDVFGGRDWLLQCPS